ncbi:hypothetical protein [Leptotrichia trevisanii]|uniref:hypothetical protein n=1 Tax=Leptotrichia trevisanii TaxID=109328 RepID=UPI0026F2F54F|nr:hypothetical protein [Leptotrichia trevisanii]
MKKILILIFVLFLNIHGFAFETKNLEQLIFWKYQTPFFWSINVILNSDSFRENELTLYFKVTDENRYYAGDFNRDRFKFTKEFFEDEFKKENLEFHYFTDGIKLKNGDIFKYGRVTYAVASHKRLRLELVFKDKNNNLRIKVYEPEIENQNEQKLSDLIEKVNSSKQEGFYPVHGFREEVSMITANKKIHQTVAYLTDDRRELYDFLLTLFKNEIPKEFFEIRKFDGRIDNDGNPEKFDWKNCNNCVRVNE